MVRYLSTMTDEERLIEQTVRATGQGRWSTGQQIGFREYRKDTYDEETKQTREEKGEINFTGEFMIQTNTDDEHYLTESTFDEEGEVNDLSTIAEDGDDDGDDDMIIMDDHS